MSKLKNYIEDSIPKSILNEIIVKYGEIKEDKLTELLNIN